MVLFGEVLDVTKFIPIHPGGPSDTDVTSGVGWAVGGALPEKIGKLPKGKEIQIIFQASTRWWFPKDLFIFIPIWGFHDPI